MTRRMLLRQDLAISFLRTSSLALPLSAALSEVDDGASDAPGLLIPKSMLTREEEVLYAWCLSFKHDMLRRRYMCDDMLVVQG